MKSTKFEIHEIVDKETIAWNNKDAEMLVSIFHPDMVWPWPENAESHDPVNWVSPMGKFNHDRWKVAWQKLFDTHEPIHNRRNLLKIAITNEQDGAFAVVDVDTLWRNCNTGENLQWKGRACKVYTKTGCEWKLISHIGLLNYSK